MTDPKELVEIVKSYGASLKRVGEDRLRIYNPDVLPDDVRQLVRVSKFELLKYLQESYFDMALRRAYHGYFWLLEHKQQQCRQQRKSLSNAHVSVQEWRQSIADVIGLNPCEVQAIENLLIKSGQFKYYWQDQYIMSIAEYANDDDYITLYDWVHAPNRNYLTS